MKLPSKVTLLPKLYVYPQGGVKLQRGWKCKLSNKLEAVRGKWTARNSPVIRSLLFSGFSTTLFKKKEKNDWIPCASVIWRRLKKFDFITLKHCDQDISNWARESLLSDTVNKCEYKCVASELMENIPMVYLLTVDSVFPVSSHHTDRKRHPPRYNVYLCPSRLYDMAHYYVNGPTCFT